MCTLLVYNVYQIIVFAVTLFFGRRWHCSMKCTMSGIHSEAFGLVLPQKPHNKQRPQSKQINKAWKLILLIFQINLFVISIVLFGLWWFIETGTVVIPSLLMIDIERIKFLIIALFLILKKLL